MKNTKIKKTIKAISTNAIKRKTLADINSNLLEVSIVFFDLFSASNDWLPSLIDKFSKGKTLFLYIQKEMASNGIKRSNIIIKIPCKLVLISVALYTIGIEINKTTMSKIK